jgi:hypothetical protein
MTVTQRVPKPPSRLEGHEGTAAAVVLVAILAAILKPWGSGSGTPVQTTAPFASPSPAPSPEPTTLGYVFDAELYGPFEPSPEWSIWPAGYFVSVKFVTRARDVAVLPGPVESAPSSPDRPTASPAIEAAPSEGPGPNWPTVVDILPGEHLLWLGINTPRGWSVRDLVLRRVEPGGTTPVSTRRLPSRWDDHFTIVGIPTTGTAETLSIWPTGDYLLEVVVAPGDLERTIVIHVRTAADVVGDPDSVQPPPVAPR